MYATTSRKRARRVSVASSEIEKSHSRRNPKEHKKMKLSDSEVSPVVVSSAPTMIARSFSYPTGSSSSDVSSLRSSESFNSDRMSSPVLTKSSMFRNHAVRGPYRPVVSPRSSSTSLSSLCSDLTLDTRTSYKTVDDTMLLPSQSINPAESFLTPPCQPNSNLLVGRRTWRIIQHLLVVLCVAAISSVSEQSGISKRTWLSVWPSRVIPQAHSVCVSGGGFSGFWYTLGRLESISDRSTKQYFCYSAGCLGVVASLSNYSMEQMWDMAYAVQMRWKRGEISRYQVVDAFLDDLLYVQVGHNRSDSDKSMAVLDTDSLSRLNVVTTVKSGWLGLEPSVRTPDSVESLRTMLIQTSWIPFAIGDDLWHDEHMDGAFTVAQHPGCEHHVGLTMDWDLYINVVNVNLGRSKVEKFWNKGLARGL